MAKVEAVASKTDPTQEATQFTCTVCKKGFDYPDFDCTRQPGKHSVETKNYYHLGGASIQNPRDRRMFSPTVVLNAGKERISDSGDSVTLGRVVITFNDGGTFSTSDPEQQYYLDRKHGISEGEEGLKAWQKIYLTPEQRKNVAETELAEIDRKIREQNDVLARAKAQSNG